MNCSIILILTVSIVIFLPSQEIFCQWTKLDSTVYTTDVDDNVGIGTQDPNPEFRLDVNGKLIVKDKIQVTQVKQRFPSISVTSYTSGEAGTGHPLFFQRNYGGNSNNRLSTPGTQTLGMYSFAGWDGQNNREIQIARIQVTTKRTFNGSNRDYPVDMIFKVGGKAFCCGATRMTIDGETGHVGIGITTPSERLTVNGVIFGEKIKVSADVTSVPDYVFESDYDLRSLEEIDEYVKTHKHLPEIPSAQEVEKEGLYLGEMSLKLLQKVEELTLYLIEHEQKMQVQEQRLKILGEENKLLKEQLESQGK